MPLPLDKWPNVYFQDLKNKVQVKVHVDECELKSGSTKGRGNGKWFQIVSGKLHKFISAAKYDEYKLLMKSSLRKSPTSPKKSLKKSPTSPKKSPKKSLKKSPKKSPKKSQTSPKSCKSGKVRDKTTKRCRNRMKPGPKMIRKYSPCKPGSTRDKKTKKCRKTKSPKKTSPKKK